MPSDQVVKSITRTVSGAAPGLAWWIATGTTQGLVLTGLGAFIGFAFSLPGVSASRVANLTVATFVAHNLPPLLGEKIWEDLTNQGAEQTAQQPTEPVDNNMTRGSPDDRLT
ncbi:MAG: hypothetical protein ABI353_18230 [Isosphaeraceae bacterium]